MEHELTKVSTRVIIVFDMWPIDFSLCVCYYFPLKHGWMDWWSSNLVISKNMDGWMDGWMERRVASPPPSSVFFWQRSRPSCLLKNLARGRLRIFPVVHPFIPRKTSGNSYIQKGWHMVCIIGMPKYDERVLQSRFCCGWRTDASFTRSPFEVSVFFLVS